TSVTILPTASIMLDQSDINLTRPRRRYSGGSDCPGGFLWSEENYEEETCVGVGIGSSGPRSGSGGSGGGGFGQSAKGCNRPEGERGLPWCHGQGHVQGRVAGTGTSCRSRCAGGSGGRHAERVPRRRSRRDNDN